MNPNQVKECLTNEEWDYLAETLRSEGRIWNSKDRTTTVVTSIGNMPFEYIGDGGVFHDGADVYKLFKLAGILFKWDGVYNSWDDSYQEAITSIYPVKPVEKIVIEYEAI